MVYRIESIGSLFDATAPFPSIDPSWLPKGTVQAPDGHLAPAPPPPSEGVSVPSAVLYAAIAALAGVAIGVIVARRARRKE